ncbi:MAG TPA: ATP-dependent helicase [Clostridia bacterium]|nr:ATP-dependent helicase [Clostridia bacterium]
MEFYDLLTEKYKIDLNDGQREAVSHVGGPALVLAGPGSGKTTVITARAARLCLKEGISPRNILTLTFNRAAAQDMKSRFEQVYGESVGGQVRFSTIHGFCNQILHDYERRQGHRFKLIESDSQMVRKEHILRGIYQDVNHKPASEEELEALAGEIGLLKNRMIKDVETFESETSTKNFGRIYRDYENLKREKLYLDYDDMLAYAYAVLRKCPDILVRYQERYPFVQVDEGQDLSKIQFELLDLLQTGTSRNLFVVADDDQSIYAFRGAEPDYILNMKQRYEGCQIFRLETNYRSSKNIVETSSRFIGKNLRRFQKKHSTPNGDGVDPSIVRVGNESEQVDFLINHIERIRTEHPDASVAVIYRNNLSSMALVDALDRRQMYFQLRQNRLHFFHHWVVQDVTALLRFAVDPMDAEAFERFYYKIGRYLSKAMIEFAGHTAAKGSFLNTLLKFPGLQPFQIRNLNELKSDFQRLSGLQPKDAMDEIESVFCYGDFIRDYCEKTGNSSIFAYNIFGILKLIAEGCETVPDFLHRITELRLILQNAAVSAEQSNLTLTTMHSAKGLEFDCVFLIDLTVDEIPGFELKGDENSREAEEERRLFYVGMTRARKLLYLVYPRFRGGVPQERSDFLNEVAACLTCPVKLPAGEIGEGATVVHSKLGTGVVESVEIQGKSVFLNVSFSGTMRTLDYTICKQNGLLEIVE